MFIDIYDTKNKYEIIYADPPWAYKVWSKKGTGRTAASHYSIMDKYAIAGLPIQNIASYNCTLFLWATFPCLPEALEIISAWGFIYKTIAFTWVKRNKGWDKWFVGMGHWTRANAEICILATRGKPKRVSKSVRQIIESPIEDHSKKPDEARDRIVKLMGNLPRIELFARQSVPGWHCWGNEIDKNNQTKKLKKLWDYGGMASS